MNFTVLHEFVVTVHVLGVLATLLHLV